MDPSKPNDPAVDQGPPIPRPRSAEHEVLEGEIIDRGVPLGRPQTAPPPSPEPSGKKPGHFRRTLLLIIVGVAALTCLAGGLTVYVYYRKASEPDRGNPTATLQQYLDARFNSRDVARSDNFVCQSPDLSSVDAVIANVEERERKFQIRIKMFASRTVLTRQTDTTATVRAEITVEIPEEGNRSSGELYTWDFGMARTDGWRVCSATQLS